MYVYAHPNNVFATVFVNTTVDTILNCAYTRVHNLCIHMCIHRVHVHTCLHENMGYNMEWSHMISDVLDIRPYIYIIIAFGICIF